MTDEQLSALLRLKRYEQPPAGYFDQLLRDVHRRQRAELLQRPLWRIALERMQTFFGEHSMGPVAYAGAMAAALIAGIATIGVMIPAVKQSRPELAEAKPAPQSQEPAFSLQPAPENRSIAAASAPFESAKPSRTFSQPRYVIDTRPASYEPSFSF